MTRPRDGADAEREGGEKKSGAKERRTKEEVSNCCVERKISAAAERLLVA